MRRKVRPPPLPQLPPLPALPPPISIASPIVTSFDVVDSPPLLVSDHKEKSPTSFRSRASSRNEGRQLALSGAALCDAPAADKVTRTVQPEKWRQGLEGQITHLTHSPRVTNPSDPRLSTSVSRSSLRSNGNYNQGTLSRQPSTIHTPLTSPNPSPSQRAYSPSMEQGTTTHELQSRPINDGMLPPSIGHRTRPQGNERDLSTSQPRPRSTPRLLHDKDAEESPTMNMLWYRAPVHGAMPGRTMRSHSATLIGNKIWIIGGYDDKQSYRDVYCLDIDSLYWSHPGFKGDIPPPCRGHTATAVEHKIIIIGGMTTNTSASMDPISVYVLDTITCTWSRPSFTPGHHPTQRRAHSAVLYDEKIWIFGGGNGTTALDDVWSLDVSTLVDSRRATVIGRNERSGLRWERIEAMGGGPASRGYHTANVIDHLMIVIGGADGKGTLDDVWILNLITPVWMHISGLQGPPARRLAHSSTQVGSYLFLFGGFDSDYSSELCLLNLVSLQIERRRVSGKIPPARGYHTAILGDTRLFIIGGVNCASAFDDVYILELASHAYLPQITEFSIEPLVDTGMYSH